MLVQIPRRMSARELVVASIVVVEPLCLSFQSIARTIDNRGVTIDELIASSCV